MRNTFLTENSKRKQNIHNMILENSKLAKKITNIANDKKLKYQAKIEQLQEDVNMWCCKNDYQYINKTLIDIEQQMIHKKI